MAKSTCQIAESIKVLGKLYNDMSGDAPGKAIMRDLYASLNEKRAMVQQAAAFVGMQPYTKIDVDTIDSFDKKAAQAGVPLTKADFVLEGNGTSRLRIFEVQLKDGSTTEKSGRYVKVERLKGEFYVAKEVDNTWGFYEASTGLRIAKGTKEGTQWGVIIEAVRQINEIGVKEFYQAFDKEVANTKEKLGRLLGKKGKTPIEVKTSLADQLEASVQVPVDSNQTGLQYALTNPTHTSPRGYKWAKGDTATRDYLSDGIEYQGKKYADVEEAYQANKIKENAPKESSHNYKLMVELITAKLKKYDKLVTWINDAGGLKYLNRIVHQPTNKGSVWETSGQDWFKSALIDAYRNVTQASENASQSTNTAQNDKEQAGTPKKTSVKIVADPWNDHNLKNGLVSVYRKHGSNQHYGNPFSSEGYGSVKTETTEEAVQMYKEWLNGEHSNVEPLRQKWVMQQIANGALDGKVLLYGNTKATKQGKESHADALAEFVNNRNTIRDDGTQQKADTATKKPLREQYREFATTLIGFVQASKTIKIKMDKFKAIRYIKEYEDKAIPLLEKEGLAQHTPISSRESEITYPDYDALLKDKGALVNIQNALNLETIKEVKTLVEQHQQSFHLEMARVHEHIHAGAVAFMRANKNDPKTKYVNNLFQRTVHEAEANPDGALNNILGGYWKKNVDEFLAIALSNPDMMSYLNSKPATDFTSVLHKLVDKIAKMINIKAGSESRALFNIFVQMAESTAVEASNSTTQEDLPPWDVDEITSPVEDTDMPPWETGENTSTGIKENTKPEKAAEPYKITETMFTNPGQTSAINKMKTWFNKKKSSTFLLQGRGGTGKTTVINVLLKELGVSADYVTFAAPTNKAVKVLAKANKNSSYKDSQHYTVAQLLGLKPEVDNDGNEYFVKDPYASIPRLGKVLVVDEASMLVSENFEELIRNASHEGTKIIFMGDHAQLPPIKDPKGRIRSVVFDATEDTAGLTELMRQREKSPIIKFTDSLISWVIDIEKQLSDKVEEWRVKQDFLKTVWDGGKFTSYDPTTNEGVILTSDTFEELLPKFLQDYKQNPEGTKFINYNSYKHEHTKANIALIRNTLFGNKALKEAFIPGEPLMMNGVYSYDAHNEDSQRVDNGEEFTVEAWTQTKKQIDYQVGQQVLRTQNTIDVHEIRARNNVTGEIVIFDKPVNDDDVNNLINSEKKYLQSIGKNPKGAFMVKKWLAHAVAHGYIINSHRSQGSTYDTVYMDMGNIAGQGTADINSIIKSMYVAASRPRTKLVVIDNRPDGGNQVINAQPAQSAGALSSTSTKHTGEILSIIDKVTNCEG